MAKSTHEIYKCGGHGWHIQSYHPPTGLPYAEELCPHYVTKRDALEAARYCTAHDPECCHSLEALTARAAEKAAERARDDMELIRFLEEDGLRILEEEAACYASAASQT